MFSELRAFTTVARCGSIRRASEQMDLAPSSISRRISILERQIGTRLMERGAGGVILTHAGRLLADFAGPMIGDYDDLCSDLNDLRGSRRQLIRVCATASIPFMKPSATIARFREHFDSITFRFDSARSEDAVRLIREGTYDIGVALRVTADQDVEVIASISEPTVLVVRNDHPLAGAAAVSLETIMPLPLAMLTESYAIRSDFDRECRRARLKPTVVLESSSLGMLIDFVTFGLGATLMPRRTVHDPNLTVIPIDSPVFRDNTLDIIVRRGRRLPRMVRLFVQALASDVAKQGTC